MRVEPVELDRMGRGDSVLGALTYQFGVAGGPALDLGDEKDVIRIGKLGRYLC